MRGMGLAKSTVFFHFNPVGIVFLIFRGGIVSTFAFGTG